MSPPPLFSPLYCRFNGFALGAFVAGASLSFAQPRYAAMRRRVHDFLDEIGVAARLPAAHAVYAGTYANRLAELLPQVRERDVQLHDFVGIGSMAVMYAAGSRRLRPTVRRMLRRRWLPVFAQYGVPAQVYERFVRSVGRAAPSRDAAMLLSQVFALVGDLLQPLATEADTCFVAMPFRAPFAERFGSYYRPALAQAGFRAIRAWGGLSAEEYYSFIGPLMARCAAVFAELSTLNLNVVNEVGLAHGANRPTFLVSGEPGRTLPSNIALLPVFGYDAGAAGWPGADVPRLARFVRWSWKHHVAALSEAGVIADSARQLMRYLQAAQQPIPDGLPALAAGSG